MPASSGATHPAAVCELAINAAAPMFGTTPEAILGQPDRDRYGRMLRYVDHAGTDAARELLATGAAWVYDTDQQLALETVYDPAAQDAHGAETGLWGNC